MYDPNKHHMLHDVKVVQIAMIDWGDGAGPVPTIVDDDGAMWTYEPEDGWYPQDVWSLVSPKKSD